MKHDANRPGFRALMELCEALDKLTDAELRRGILGLLDVLGRDQLGGVAGYALGAIGAVGCADCLARFVAIAKGEQPGEGAPAAPGLH